MNFNNTNNTLNYKPACHWHNSIASKALGLKYFYFIALQIELSDVRINVVDPILKPLLQIENSMALLRNTFFIPSIKD